MDTDFKQRLMQIPRLRFAETPTPLEHLPRLSAKLGRNILVKRDDQLGPGLGGNKTRKLEYLLAQAQQQGAKKVVTFGGLQSNHARLTVACANRLGMECHILYFDPRPPVLEGNLLINQRLGARLHFIPLGGGGGMSLETTIRLVRLIAWAIVGPNYYIPVGGHTWLGCIGYVQAALEITEQVNSIGIKNARIFLAAGSGGTLAGLMAGLRLAGSPIRLQGIDVGKLWSGFPKSIATLAGEICHHLGVQVEFTPNQVPLIERDYAGEKYGIPSLQGLATMHQLARLEGMILDPVYTAKAFAGMLDLVKKDAVSQEETIIFLHTGGIPALFAFDEVQLGLL